MHSYHAHGPVGSKYENLFLRVCTYVPQLYTESDQIKVIIQTMEGGEPIAEDPLFTAYVSQEELDSFLAGSTEEGWLIETDPTDVILKQHAKQVKAAGRASYHKSKQKRAS